MEALQGVGMTYRQMSGVVSAPFYLLYFLNSFYRSRLGVKQGKENDMENQNEEQGNNVEQNNTENHASGNQEKTFTQEEVNQIVQSRLARAKFESAPDFSAREAELSRRETRLDAREKLADAGLPKELVSALNCSNKETMEKSIETLISFLGSNTPNNPPNNANATGVYRVSTGSMGKSETNTSFAKDAEIRKAMGLKG